MFMGDCRALACLPAIGMRPTVITLHGSHLLRRASGTSGRLRSQGGESACLRPRGGSHRRVRVRGQLRSGDRAGRRRADQADSQRGPGCPTGVRRRSPCGAGDPRGRARFVRRCVRRRAQRAQAAGPVRGGRRAARIEQPRIVGMVVGEGPLRGRLEPMAGDGLKVLGERQDVTNLLAGADAFAAPLFLGGPLLRVARGDVARLATVVSVAPATRMRSVMPAWSSRLATSMHWRPRSFAWRATRSWAVRWERLQRRAPASASRSRE